MVQKYRGSDQSLEKAVYKDYIGKLIKSYEMHNERATSYVSDFWQPWVRPPVDFVKCYEYYFTIGKVQNTVDSIIAKIIARGWYYDSETDSDVTQMEKWEDDFNGRALMEEILRNWFICGPSIIGWADWLPMQLSTVLGVKRDLDGNNMYIVQTVNGVINYLDAKDFLWTGFIETNREAWPRGLFHSLMTPFTDIDGRQAIATIENYRQTLTDMAKIYHKFASPRVIWTFDGANEVEINENLAPLVGSMGPGDRLVLNREAKLMQEVVDFRVHFDKSIDQFNQELEAGLQTSHNRVITQPSAMADAQTADDKDDEKILGIMEKLSRLFNTKIIPAILGPDAKGRCEFKWGSQDSFELEYPPGLHQAFADGVISPEETRKIMVEHLNWDLDDALWTIAKNRQDQQSMMQNLAQAGNRAQLIQAAQQQKQQQQQEEDAWKVIEILKKYK